MSSDIKISNIQEIDVFFKAKNPITGAIVPVVGVPVWSSSDEGLATLFANPDGMSGVLESTGVNGVGTGFVDYEISVDGANISHRASFEFTISESGLVIGEFTFGEPRNRS